MTNAEKIAKIMDEIAKDWCDRYDKRPEEINMDMGDFLKRELPKYVMPKLSWDEILNKLENLLRELNTYGLPPTYREEAKAILTAIGYDKPSKKEEG